MGALGEAKTTVPPGAPGPLPSLSARRTTLLDVAVIVASTFIFCPAFSIKFPLFVVVAADTYTSRPAIAIKLPLVVVITAFTFTSSTAFRVSVAAVVQVSVSETMISPVPATLPGESLVMMMFEVVPFRLALRVTPSIPPPVPMVKLFGSSSQVPAVP